MKTAHFKKTLTNFNILSTRCDTKNLHWAPLLKARRRAFRCIAWPSVRQQGKTLHFFKKLDHFCLIPFTVEGPAAPPPSSAPRALTGARRCCSYCAALVESITLPKQTLVAVPTHAPLWVRHVDVDSTHQTLMGD